MEKNLLPIAVANARPNPDQYSHQGWDTQFQNCFFEVYQDAQTETQKVFCVKRPGVSSSNAWSLGTYPNGHTTGYALGCFTAQPHTSTKVYFAVYGSDSGLAHLYYFDGTTVSGFGSHSMPTYKRINFVDVGLPNDTYTVGWTAGANLYLVKDAGVINNSTPHSSTWITATSYSIGGTVLNSSTHYTCIVEHTSGTFANDLASGYWVVSSSPDLTRPVYMNNRVFVGDRVTGNIIQSGLGTYSTFSQSEYIVAESYGGKLVDLGRYNNFIVAFKEFSMEFFEDVANQNGTVLGRVGQAEQQVGCVHPNTIVDTGAGELVWLSTDRSGHRSVKMLSNSFQCDDIADAFLSKMLNLTTSYDGSYAFLLNANGHQFYILTLKQNYTDSSNSADFANITYAYDLKTKLWTLWTTPTESVTFTDSASGATITTVGRWNYAGACVNLYNTTLVQEYDTGVLHVLDDYICQDKGVAIQFIMQLSNVDFGTNKRKFLNRLSLYADSKNLTTLEFLLYLIRNDFNTTPSDQRPLVSYSADNDTAFATFALGSGKKFTIKITSTSNTPIRVSAINIDYDIGEGHGIS